MVKKYLGLVLVFLMLNGCGGDDNGGIDTSTVGKYLYETDLFSISYPQDWEVREKADFTSNVPGSVVVAFRNNIKNEIFTANLVIAVSQVPENTSSIDVSKSNKESAKTSLISFLEISDTEYAYADGAIQSILSEYQGKKSPSEPIVIFKQLPLVYNGNAYTITAGYLPNEDEAVVKLLDEMIESFALK